MVTTKDAYEIGEIPPLGEVPQYMYAHLIRPERFGEPIKAFQVEKVETPAELKPREALVLVMAAGINYNNVWAARGLPVNVIKAREREGDMTGFHIGGSDASGIVYKVGSDVTNIKVGDQVVIHCGMWDEDTDFVKAGNDPMFDPSFRIWGYESNWGSFAQFTKVQAHQCLPKAPHLTWEEAAAPTLVGATAYRMLRAWPPHTVEKDDVVLVWGGSGGLGSMAIQIAREFGAIPVAVVSSEDKFDFCLKLGAKGCINRKDFDHWGMLPHWTDNEPFAKWSQGARAFGAKFWEVLGERRSPRIVFEHPGEDTIPTSIFMCDTGGMVVICAGTSGFNATVDLRYLWMRQKRLQGSHFANDEQAGAFNQLVVDGKIDPCLGETYSFEDIGKCHHLMYEGKQPLGVMAALVSAKRTGMREVD
jgi:crotonyl-CoA carboxylase/reductase